MYVFERDEESTVERLFFFFFQKKVEGMRNHSETNKTNEIKIFEP
jgi:hypothetical protein